MSTAPLHVLALGEPCVTVRRVAATGEWQAALVRNNEARDEMVTAATVTHPKRHVAVGKLLTENWELAGGRVVGEKT